MTKVAILISSYNGELFIRELIDSIYASDGIGSLFNLDVYLRDDGSSDSTVQLVQSLYGGRVIVFKGDNLGPSASFINLAHQVSNVYDFYMVCDQDDVWKSDKIKRAVISISLQDPHVPTLYYCGLDIVNSNLGKIGEYHKDVNKSNDLVFSLAIGSLIPGCTMAWNKKLMELFVAIPPISFGMHDALLHIVCLLNDGIVIEDKDCLILYRQHSNNVVGMKKATTFDKIKKAAKRKNIYSSSYFNLLGVLTNDYRHYDLLSLFANYKKSLKTRIRLTKIKSKYMSFSEIIKFKFKVLMGWF